jgi:hypothetical protein
VDQKVPLNDHAAAARLLGLLDYVDALIKLDERVAMRLNQHKLQDGSQFVLHEHELTKLPGVSLNKSDDEGPIWLRVQRLQRTAPPTTNEEIVEWIEISQDPDVACSIKSELHKRLTEEEKEALVKQNKLRLEDCSPSLKEEKANGRGAHFDVFFRLEDQPETRIRGYLRLRNVCLNLAPTNPWSLYGELALPAGQKVLQSLIFPSLNSALKLKFLMIAGRIFLFVLAILQLVWIFERSTSSPKIRSPWLSRRL